MFVEIDHVAVVAATWDDAREVLPAKLVAEYFGEQTGGR